MSLALGCIADDFTGATDLANNLVRASMRVVQTIGVPAAALEAPIDAVVIALNQRMVFKGHLFVGTRCSATVACATIR
jgi:uncharacterized protein YgbK (DUF1537 family)